MLKKTNYHIGVGCPYTKTVWKEIKAKYNLQNLSVGDSLLSCLKKWVLNIKVKAFRALPIIVSWFIWKARNNSCFDDFLPTPAQVSAYSLGMLSSYP